MSGRVDKSLQQKRYIFPGLWRMYRRFPSWGVEKDARVGEGKVIISLSLSRWLELFCCETDFSSQWHFRPPHQSREGFIQIEERILTAYLLGKMSADSRIVSLRPVCFIRDVPGDRCKSLTAALEFLWLLQKYLKCICLACSSVCLLQPLCLNVINLEALCFLF